MKYFNSWIFFVILFFVMNNHGMSQEKSKCYQKIRNYYDDMAKIDFPKEKKVYYFNYINETESYNDRSIVKNKVSVHVYMGKDQMHNITKDIEIYQDMEDAFMVIIPRKTIIRTESTLKLDKEQRLQSVLHFQDSLFRHMVLKNCQEVTNKNGKEFLVVDMVLDSLTNAYHGLRNIRFTYDVKEGEVKRVKFDYLPGQKLKSLTQRMAAIDLNHSRKLNTPVKDLFLTKEENLKPKYAGYKYVNKK